MHSPSNSGPLVRLLAVLCMVAVVLLGVAAASASADTPAPSPSPTGMLSDTPDPPDPCLAKGTGQAFEKCETGAGEKACAAKTGGALMGCAAVWSVKVCQHEGFFGKGACEQATQELIQNYALLQSVKKVPTQVVSSVATSAFDGVAKEIGAAAQWLLQQFAGVFLDVSTINLSASGVSPIYAAMWGLSALIAALLLTLQMAKLAYTADGKVLVTALTGLARWTVITMTTFAVVQAGLTASDAISQWLVDDFFGGDAQLKQRLGDAFGALLSSSTIGTPIIAVLGLVAIVVLALLWLEMLLRQAALSVLVAVMPITASGTIADATQSWWPKARNAVVTLILVKPLIVLMFVIGFQELAHGADLQSFLVGLLTILLAAIAWPSLARFVTFTSAGGGGAFAGGFLGALGGTAGSAFAMRGLAPSGAGASTSAQGYTAALQAENDSAVRHGGGGGGGGGRGGGFGGGGGRGGGGGAGGGGGGGSALMAGAMALQAAKAGKELVEGGMANMAAHAELGSTGDMGHGVQVPPGGLGGSAQPPAPRRSPDAARTGGGGGGGGGTGGGSTPVTPPPPRGAPPQSPPAQGSTPLPPPPPPTAPPSGA